MRVGKRLLAEELVVKADLVIASDKDQMQMGKRLAVIAAEDADGDGLVVDDWEGLICIAHGSGQQSHSSGKGECERSDHELRLIKPIGAMGCS
jgi:hypothetical protein